MPVPYSPGDRGSPGAGAAAGRVLGGRYRLDTILGRGGMGAVWRAHDLALDRPVAVKVLELADDGEATGVRFRREARSTAALTHPNIVTVHDTGTDGQTAYLVMELLPGPTIGAQLAAGGPLPVEEVAAVGAQVAAALAAAHAVGIVHRDISPANVAWSAPGTVKVLDFGIATLADPVAGGRTLVEPLTATGQLLGTAPYLSPEQAAGRAATPSSDLYALGCLLFAALTGRPPYAGGTGAETLAAHLNAEVPDVAALRGQTPPGLAAVVTALLAKDPADRPADAATVAAALTALPVSGVVDAAVTTPTAPLPMVPAIDDDRQRRSRALLLGAAAVVAVIAAIVIAVAANTGDNPTATPPATAPPTSALTASPSATPTPTHPATTAPAATPQQAVQQLRAAVSRAMADGGIAQADGQDLLNRLNDISMSLGHGNAKDTNHKVNDFAHRVQDLQRGGKLSNAAAADISAPLQRLEQLLGSPSSDNQGGNGD